MRYVLVVILLLLTNIGYSQNKNKSYDIYINSKAGFIYSKTGISSGELRITIKKTRKNTKIIYTKLDSVNYERASQDPEFERISNLFLNSNYFDNSTSTAGKEFAKQFEQLIQKYSFYTKDSIHLKNKENDHYIATLDEFYSADEARLVSKEAENRIVLDGALMHLIIKVKDKVEKEFFVQSPTNDSHPLIHKLMRDSLNLYRVNHPNSFLD